MASHSHDLTISVYGHSSANPESVASLFGGKHVAQSDGSEDVAIFVINPNTGVDEQTVALNIKPWSASLSKSMQLI